MPSKIEKIKLLGIEPTKDLENKIERYLDILFEWNTTTSLTSVSREEFLEKHVIFSYNYILFVERFENIFDFGSGNGVPGLPLSFVFPKKKFILVENRKRKIAFLEYVSSAICENVEVVDSSIYPAPEEYLNNFGVVAKAFHNFKTMRKFFRRPFELLLPLRELKETKNITILEIFHPQLGESENITFYRIFVPYNL